ncbi:MAG: hypothetical protein QGG40_14410 [Myxococcota bacterium]|nr:hypothetical protein [Myxococcota bacterium]
MKPERLEILMVKVTDETCTPPEREELMTHLSQHPELRLELERHQALRAVTEGWVARLELDLVEDRRRASSGVLSWANTGVGLFVTGIVLIEGWGLYKVIVDDTESAAVRAGIGVLAVGMTILLGWVILWRLRTVKKDRYEEVIR